MGGSRSTRKEPAQTHEENLQAPHAKVPAPESNPQPACKKWFPYVADKIQLKPVTCRRGSYMTQEGCMPTWAFNTQVAIYGLSEERYSKINRILKMLSLLYKGETNNKK